jgi:hypothetical protein
MQQVLKIQQCNRNKAKILTMIHDIMMMPVHDMMEINIVDTSKCRP